MQNHPHHISATISPKSAEYLEWLEQQAERSGQRLSKATIIRALLNVAMRLDLDVSEIATQRELEDRIWETMRRTHN